MVPLLPACPLSQVQSTTKTHASPAGDDLLLYNDWRGGEGTQNPHGSSEGVWLCVLNSRAGACDSVRLKPTPQAHGRAIYHLSALTICREGGVAAVLTSRVQFWQQPQATSLHDQAPRIELFDLQVR